VVFRNMRNRQLIYRKPLSVAGHRPPMDEVD
jgi:hypothetical protein